jgi:predicted N-acyltransferase
VLFCRDDEFAALEQAGFAARLGLQFHWTNRQPGRYANFDDFLSAFRSRNRKQVRKERAVAASHGLELVTRPGTELSDADWAALETFYEANIDRHGGARYLTPAFFQELRRHFAHRVVASLAYRPGEGRRQARPVAGTLNFERGRHLYGRYWGCVEQQEMLHFELCYYQLIDRAITRGYTRFEAGAQGEHKLKRGLEPTLTFSAHWIADRGLSAAVGRFLQAERAAAQQELREYQQLSPYARTGPEPGNDPE